MKYNKFLMYAKQAQSQFPASRPRDLLEMHYIPSAFSVLHISSEPNRALYFYNELKLSVIDDNNDYYFLSCDSSFVNSTLSSCYTTEAHTACPHHYSHSN